MEKDILNMIINHFGCTQKEFAALIDEQPYTVSRWCNGSTRLKAEKLAEIAKKVNVGYEVNVTIHEIKPIN
ncbi:Helix-turn-helix [Pustulibacterium marinum]|uniref:Helix-turn-helix n=1 Tax=Pustulibacterium marinum TaxID=1224947 RepID=A0A1I7IVK1_9FLAO|nr:helix-turn-helix transcriptional regulator [Pustulibacterium marinum]SFU76987.1 Helix-turn-helix [Pustulibacterium marinum]